MIFEVRKGRECSVALTASLERITALENLNHSQGQLIEIRGQEIARLKELDGIFTLRLSNQSELFQIEKSKLRAKIKKRNRIIFGQAAAIVVLVLLL